MESWLVTGGAGFIGANFVQYLRRLQRARVVNLDALTYAGHLESLEPLAEDPDHVFVHGNIGDRELAASLLREHRIRVVVNFAAESHVDRSIDGPAAFVETNVVGTLNFLDAVRAYWQSLPDSERRDFRFLHVSTDEVYGSLGPEGYFSETSPYAPNSPYAASKAASDHLVRAWSHTYGLPTLTTNCSNNYGPYQFPEKLIPLVILNAVEGKPLPVYGDGMNVRDWLYVLDHCEAILTVIEGGRPGETYNIGGRNERTNIEVVRALCACLDELLPVARNPVRPRSERKIRRYEELIAMVSDRPGHDRRYAVDAGKIERELGWRPKETFESAIRRTVAWYLENGDWVGKVSSGGYDRGRLGLAG